MPAPSFPLRAAAGCVAISVGLLIAGAGPAAAAPAVSQATAQAVRGDIAGALDVAVSNPATDASNDGTGSNAAQTNSPAVSALSGQSFATAGALDEVAEANTDGSSYGCSGVASPGGGVQVGSDGQTCTATGNGTGGVTLDLGKLPGLGTLATVAGGDIRITLDSVVAHAYLAGGGSPVRGADVAGVTARLGTGAPVTIPVPASANQDLLSAVLSALNPQLGIAGATTSALLRGAVELTANFQPAAANGTYAVSGLHVALLGNGAGTADLARVTVGPNVTVAPVDAVSFGSLPIVLTALALLIALGVAARAGVRRVRAAA